MKNNKDIKITVVVSMFNETISNNLLYGATEKFHSLGGNKNNLSIVSVPGAFEIPSTVNQVLKKSNDIDAIITLGCIINGETAHFEYIASSVSNSISQLSIRAEVPIIFGILTTYNYQQALIRSDIKKKDKGGEVMEAAMKTILTYKKINK